MIKKVDSETNEIATNTSYRRFGDPQSDQVFVYRHVNALDDCGGVTLGVEGILSFTWGVTVTSVTRLVQKLR